jgi:hypothetical protein
MLFFSSNWGYAAQGGDHQGEINKNAETQGHEQKNRETSNFALRHEPETDGELLVTQAVLEPSAQNARSQLFRTIGNHCV